MHRCCFLCSATPAGPIILGIMKRQLVLALSLLVFGTGQAPTRAIVEGVVVKTGTIEPVTNADVSLTLGPSATPTPPPTGGGNAIRVKTDASGKFVFPDLAPGRYSLAVARDGFIRPRRSGRGCTRPVRCPVA